MPYDALGEDAEHLVHVRPNAGLKDVIGDVEQLAARVQEDAATFQGQTAALRRSAFYTHMRDLKSGIIG